MTGAVLLLGDNTVILGEQNPLLVTERNGRIGFRGVTGGQISGDQSDQKDEGRNSGKNDGIIAARPVQKASHDPTQEESRHHPRNASGPVKPEALHQDQPKHILGTCTSARRMPISLVRLETE